MLPTNTTLNYNAIASQFDGNALLSDFDFISLKSGRTTITAQKNSDSGAANSIKVGPGGGVQTFNAGTANNGQTTSVRQGGLTYFTTPTADTSQTVSVGTKGGAGTIALKQTAATTNQTLANKLYGLTLEQGLLLAGAGVGIFLIFKVVGK